MQNNLIDLKGIKNIIFDLGGVVVNINYNLTLDAFRVLGFHHFDSIYTQIKQTPLFDLFETGKISSSAFREEIRKQFPMTDTEFDKAWCAMLLDTPEERIDLIKKLKEKYRVFLLSNTNDIHINYYLGALNKTYGYDVFSAIFEHTYYSHEVGLRKPDREIYDFIVKKEGLQSKETLFIDDLKANVNGAIQAGLTGYYLEKGTIQDLFKGQF